MFPRNYAGGAPDSAAPAGERDLYWLRAAGEPPFLNSDISDFCRLSADLQMVRPALFETLLPLLDSITPGKIISTARCHVQAQTHPYLNWSFEYDQLRYGPSKKLFQWLRSLSNMEENTPTPMTALA